MGVYIKGMEMPKDGEYRMTLYVFSDGSAGIDVDSFPEDSDRFEAVPVPPHGRLIDADALHYCRVQIVHPGGIVGGYNAVVMSAEINAAPTIIPADKDGAE